MWQSFSSASGTKKVANVHMKFFHQHQNGTTLSHVNHLLNRVVSNEKQIRQILAFFINILEN